MIAYDPNNEKPLPLDRYLFTVAIVAGLFTAVRLARLADEQLSEPKLTTTVRQGVLLAKAILAEAVRR